MGFVHVNRIWDNPDYVNMVDVDFFGDWERIYFTARALSQTVLLTLVNPDPPQTPDLGNEAQQGAYGAFQAHEDYGALDWHESNDEYETPDSNE